MRQRTKFRYNDEELKSLYQGYHVGNWWDHRYRAELSSTMIGRFCIDNRVMAIADLSAGDGSILSGALNYIEKMHGLSVGSISPVVGDFSVENCFTLRSKFEEVVCGKIEDTILEMDDVELFILSETIEHVEDPDTLLALISSKSNAIFLSTPLDEVSGTNPEHYWSWGKDDIAVMLGDAGFTHFTMYSELDFAVSKFQMWLVTK